MFTSDMSNLSSAQAPRGRLRLGEHLLAQGLLNDVALHAALEEQRVTRERLGLILTRNQLVSRAALIQAILDLAPQQIHSEEFITARVPPEFLIERQAMVVAETADTVYLATLQNEAQVALDIQEYYPELAPQFVAASHEQITNYTDKLRSMISSEDSVVDRLLRRAFAEGASDIHIVPRYASYSVFFRVLGVRHHRHEGPLDEYNTLCARIKDMSRMDLAERRVSQDGNFSLEFNSKLVDVRVATLPINGEYLVLRLLDPSRVQPSLEGLGITQVREWRKGVSRPDGLALICGPTGSGKTTTLNASLKEMDRYGSAIFTVEDPVEYKLPYLGQMSANPAVGLDFARAVRAFMRSDPDVIVVGEIRDAETARNAIKSGETGHMTLGTLHTGSIHGAVQRLRDLGVPAAELLHILRVVMVQRLVRTTCPHCKGVGCVPCNKTGYAGRTVVSEVQYFSSEEDVQRLLDGDRWWRTLLDDAMDKYAAGVTDAREIIRVFGEEGLQRVNQLDKDAG